jgi:hypothetical protein
VPRCAHDRQAAAVVQLALRCLEVWLASRALALGIVGRDHRARVIGSPRPAANSATSSAGLQPDEPLALGGGGRCVQKVLIGGSQLLRVGRQPDGLMPPLERDCCLDLTQPIKCGFTTWWNSP